MHFHRIEMKGWLKRGEFSFFPEKKSWAVEAVLTERGRPPVSAPKPVFVPLRTWHVWAASYSTYFWLTQNLSWASECAASEAPGPLGLGPDEVLVKLIHGELGQNAPGARSHSPGRGRFPPGNHASSQRLGLCTPRLIFQAYCLSLRLSSEPYNLNGIIWLFSIITCSTLWYEVIHLNENFWLEWGNHLISSVLFSFLKFNKRSSDFVNTETLGV